MDVLRLMGISGILVLAAHSAPLTLTSGDIYVQANLTDFYLDTLGAWTNPGFFGTLEGLPSDPVTFGTLHFSSDHAGVQPSSSPSNIEAMSLSFTRGMPSATMSVFFSSVDNPAVADTVLTLLNNVTLSLPGGGMANFGFQPFVVHGVAPLPVSYGGQVRYFDATLRFEMAGGPGTFVESDVFSVDETSGQFIPGIGLLSQGSLTFTNPEMGTFTAQARLRAERGGGTWTVVPEPGVPEPGSLALLLIGALFITALGRNRRPGRSGGDPQSSASAAGVQNGAYEQDYWRE